jgi:beta-lactamase class D
MFLFSCSPNNVKLDPSLEKYFTENKVKGTFAMMNNGTGEFTIYNLSRYRDSSFLPASTFKIVNSLIGLQTGVITGDSMIIKWDGVKRRDAWDKDLTMYEAFRVSAVPYYQEVARRIGYDAMQKGLDTLSYGTKNITTKIDTFWLDNSLRISPDEQLGLVKRLYFRQLPFFTTYQDIVKKAMLFENNANYKLSYKTGWGQYEGKQLGWMVGWVEENEHPYFFVLNIESEDPNFDMVNVRLKMLKDILKHLGFFSGKM